MTSETPLISEAIEEVEKAGDEGSDEDYRGRGELFHVILETPAF